jgi:pimeloyl-ACP methyl ester carboxylesterase
MTVQALPHFERILFELDNGMTLVGELTPPTGRTAILLHGGGQTRHSWGSTARALSRLGWQAVSVDLRGHGESEWSPDGSYRLEDFAEDVKLLAGRFDCPVLIGASLGGMSSLLAVGESTDQVASALLLVDITPRREPEGIKRIHTFMSTGTDGFESLEEVADAVASYMPHRDRPSDISGLRKNVRLRDDGRLVWHWDPKFLTMTTAVDGEPATDDFFSEDRLYQAAARVEIPTLLIRGMESDIVTERGVEDLLGLIPHAAVVQVSRAGHMVAGDRNDRFTAAVVDFLGSLSA